MGSKLEPTNTDYISTFFEGIWIYIKLAKPVGRSKSSNIVESKNEKCARAWASLLRDHFTKGQAKNLKNSEIERKAERIATKGRKGSPTPIALVTCKFYDSKA